jgi:hypothetical protein
MSSLRERYIETACQLIERQGYHATGLNQIVKRAACPRDRCTIIPPEARKNWPHKPSNT